MQWHQPCHMQTICTSLQTDNHTSSYGPVFVCPSHTGIVSKRLDGSSWFLLWRLPSTCPTLSCSINKFWHRTYRNEGTSLWNFVRACSLYLGHRTTCWTVASVGTRGPLDKYPSRAMPPLSLPSLPLPLPPSPLTSLTFPSYRPPNAFLYISVSPEVATNWKHQCWAVWVLTDSCSLSSLIWSDRRRQVLPRKRCKTVRLGFKPKLGVLQ